MNLMAAGARLLGEGEVKTMAGRAKSGESAADCWRRNVAAVVVDELGRVLLGVTGERSRHYHFPQGGVERRESMTEAVLRELHEESGLETGGLRPVARFGGLRYRYRDKNRKSARWQGQEQTYFLLRYAGLLPAQEPPSRKEFVRMQPLPWPLLHADAFVSFKRKVVARVLEHFFPSSLAYRGASMAELEAHWAENCRTRRYLSAAGERPDFGMRDDLSLFGGGKEEAEDQFADAQLELQDVQARAAERGESLVVLPLSLPGAGRRGMLRRLGRCLDPLRLAVSGVRPAPGDDSLTARFRTLEPVPGQVLMLLDSPYDELLQELTAFGRPDVELLPDHMRAALHELEEAEAALRARGMRFLRVYLNAGVQEGEEAELESRATAEAWAARLMTAEDWLVVPAAHKWYRNLVCVRAVLEAFGSV